MVERQVNGLVHWIGVLSSAVPYFVLSWILFGVWRDPMAWDDGAWVRYGVGLLALEFILLHSGVFIGSMMAKSDHLVAQLKLVGVLLVFYGLMAWGMAMAVDSYQLLWVFAGVTVGRFVTILTAQAEGSQAIIARSGVGAFLYLVGAFCSIFLPIPEWGITNSIVARVYPNRGGGIWEQDPERAIATAAVYFLLLGLAELFIFGPRKPDRGDAGTT